jgi:predicted O-methyltransferase YrrM
LGQIDFVFIDGNHRLEPTLRYFEMLLKHATPNTILVFDDIHWSQEMELAWKSIQENSSVTCTVDLFFLGLVFLRKDFKVKQHFTIRF